MYSLDDIGKFVELLERERPNLLLLGAMTLSFPGALECARIAREKFGDEIFIVLGGRHASETIWLDDPSQRFESRVVHHLASPVALMKRGLVPCVFDLVVSGDGELVISTIGELLVHVLPGEAMAAILSGLRTQAIPGDWIAVACRNGEQTVVSRGIPLNYNELPSIASIYGVSAAFDVFEGRMTAHVFSDTGQGCVYDCTFCSERRSTTGGLRDISRAPERLYRQMSDAVKVIQDEWPGRGASAFVEDSILLGGSPKQIEQFCELLENDPVDIDFGVQFTIDQILRRQPLIERLSRVGMRYVFIGLETADPTEIGGMSKDIGSALAPWQQRFRSALTFLAANGIKCGCAILFGLGESHSSRISLLDGILDTRIMLGGPVTVSANWAVCHPLRAINPKIEYEYIDWGTPDGPYLELFHNFGEASLRYPLPDVRKPTLDELADVVNRLRKFHSLAELAEQS